MTRKAVFSLIILAVAVALFWIFNPAKGRDVEITSPQHSAAVQAVYATGTVEASRMVPIAPKIAARLLSLEVDEGSKVMAGTILAKLEDTDLQGGLKELQAKLDLAQKDFARAQKLGKSGAISKEGLDQSQAAFTAAQAAVERAQAEVSYLQLTAPEDGTIIRRDGEIGEVITSGTSVFWINAGNSLRIETEVDEEDIGLVQPGQKVAISADAFPGQIFDGTVQSITPKGDAVARSYRVRVTLAEDTPLMIGMTAETNIITQEKDDALMIPAGAVVNGQVIKIVAGKGENAAVKTGIKTVDAVEILDGISAEDKIAAKYDATLLDGGRLKTKVSAWKAVPAKE